MPMPKRMRSTRSSRGVSEARTRVVVTIFARHGSLCIPVSCRPLPYRCACLCAAHSEGEDAMQQVRVFKSVMPSRCSELLAFRYFGVGIGFNEIGRAVGSEAKVDTCVAVEPQCPVDAFRRSLNAGVYLRREVSGRPVHDSDTFLIIGIVFGLFGGDLPRALTAQAAELQFPNRQNAQPVVAEHADIELASLDVLLGDSGSSEPLVNEGDALCELLVRIDDRCLRDPVGS